jgi:hypothetical protein
LAKGPNLLELIPKVLLKFQEKRIGVISDTKRECLQISVCQQDQDYLWFLWWLKDDKGKREAWYLTYFSKYTRILRMVTWMLRLANNARRMLPDRAFGELSVDETLVAEKVPVRIMQSEMFTSDEISRLKSWQVFEDKEVILCVRTKTVEWDDVENFKDPVLLPSDHRLVALLIQEHHLRLVHAGLHTLLLKLQENFWMLRGRRTVLTVLSRCIRCKKHEQKGIQVVPGTLPEDRVRDASVFEVTGVDLAGPLFLKEGRK